MESHRSYICSKKFMIRQTMCVITCIIAFILSLNFSPVRVQAAAGDLDPTFGTGGKVTTNYIGYGDSASAVAIQKDGKIIVGGTAGRTSDFGDFGLVRYNPDGSLDLSFGVNGKVRTPFEIYAAIEVIAIQEDGKIVAGGDAYIEENDFALARYNADGNLDLTFGTDGKIVMDFFDETDHLDGLAIQPDGKLLVTGSVSKMDNFAQIYTEAAIVRYNSNGTLDSSFGNAGKVVTNFLGRLGGFGDFVLLPDGKILTASGTNGIGGYDLFRFNADGSYDNSFGNGGRVETYGLIGVAAIKLQSDGKIIIASSMPAGSPATIQFAIERRNADGTLDMTFGTNGRTLTEFNDAAFIFEMKITRDDKILAVGENLSFNITFALARYNANGTPDITFGNGGKLTTSFFGQYDVAKAVAIQQDGKIIAAGYSAHNSIVSDFAVARYDGGISYDVCLQDDNSNNILQMNSQTGDYQFTDCSGVTIQGLGTLNIRGNVISLQHNTANRIIQAKVDNGTKKASASVRLNGQPGIFTISDRNVGNNICHCR
jgi:uncharacterized delta-60 repeat protein